MDLGQLAKHIEFDVSWLKAAKDVRYSEANEVGDPEPCALVRVILTSGTSGEAEAVGIVYSDLMMRLKF